MQQIASAVNPLGAPDPQKDQVFFDNWGSRASDVLIGLRGHRSKAPTRARQFSTVAEAVPFTQDLSNASFELWASYASFTPAPAPTAGPRSRIEVQTARHHTNLNVAALDRFWFDIDVKASGVTKSGQPCYTNQIDALAAARLAFEGVLGLQPTYINSGYGIHVHVELDQTIPPAQWKPLASGFVRAIAAQDIKLVADKSKWHVESAYMRLPGTYNKKDGQAPQPVYVIELGALHSLSEIEAVLAPVTQAIDQPTAAPTPMQAAAARAAKPRRSLVKSGARDLEQLAEILPFLARIAKPGDTFNIIERDGCFRIAAALQHAVAEGADPVYAERVFLDALAAIPEANANYTDAQNLDLWEQARKQQERKDSEGASTGERGGLLTVASVRKMARKAADDAGILEHMRPETIVRTDKAKETAQRAQATHEETAQRAQATHEEATHEEATHEEATHEEATHEEATHEEATHEEVTDSHDAPHLTTSIEITAEGPPLFKPRGYGSHKSAGHGLPQDGMSDRFAPFTDTAGKMLFYDLQERRVLNASAMQYATGITEKVLKAWVPTVPQYKGIVSDIAAPFGAIVEGKVNTFTGMTVQSRPGNCDVLLDMIFEVIAAGDPSHYEWLIRYAAWLWQNPASNPGVAVVLHSEEEGTGKTSFAKILMKLFDPAAQKVSQQKHVTGNFNSLLEGTRILFAEESFFAGDHRVRGPLKDLITADHIVIERKRQDAYSAQNRMAVIMASNEDFVVPAGPMARRFAVFDVATHRARDKDYWDAVHDAIDNPDVIAAFAYYCETIDLTGWRPASTVPTTSALVDQKVETARGTIDGFLIDALSMGIIYDDPSSPNPGTVANMRSGDWQNGAIKISGDQMNDLVRAINKYLGPRSAMTRNKVVRRLTKIFGRAIHQRDMEERYYVLPRLDAARALMEQHVKGGIDWGDDGAPMTGIKRPKLTVVK